MQKKKLAYAVRFDMNLPSKHNISTKISPGKKLAESEYYSLSLPLYSVEKLVDILDQIRMSV